MGAGGDKDFVTYDTMSTAPTDLHSKRMGDQENNIIVFRILTQPAQKQHRHLPAVLGYRPHCHILQYS
jgi:hypothetical protein